MRGETSNNWSRTRLPPAKSAVPKPSPQRGARPSPSSGATGGSSTLVVPSLHDLVDYFSANPSGAVNVTSGGTRWGPMNITDSSSDEEASDAGVLLPSTGVTTMAPGGVRRSPNPRGPTPTGRTPGGMAQNRQRSGSSTSTTRDRNDPAEVFLDLGSDSDE